MLFSVVIPAFNARKYIEVSLTSLAAQTCQDFEIVIVDDGSTDGTAEFLDAYADAHHDTTVIHQKNSGPLLARRAGVAASLGEYILFLDSDDEFVPEAFETIRRQIECFHADIVAFSFVGAEDPICASSVLTSKGVYFDRDDYSQVKKYVCEGRTSNLCSKCFNRRLFDQADYSAFSGMRHGEDWFQLFPLVDTASSLIAIPDQLYIYNQGDQSGTASYNHGQLADIRNVCKRLWVFAEKWGGECLRAAASGEILNYIYLVKINELSVSSLDEKRAHFIELSSAMRSDGTFRRCECAALRFDNRIIVFALKRRCWRLARFVVLTVELIKHRGR